jgi:hypothetical protein
VAVLALIVAEFIPERRKESNAQVAAE